MNGEFVTAVHAMVYLHHKGGRVTSEELADNICTNAGCVRREMTKLCKRGLAETRAGRSGGGYRYEKTRTVNLRQIAEAVACTLVEAGYRSGGEDKECRIASGMSSYIEGLCSELDDMCKIILEKITVADVERSLTERANI